MAKVPFPCCCTPDGDCGDYDATWQYEMDGIVSSPQDSYANAETNEVSFPAGYHWYYWDVASALTTLNAWSQSFTFDPADEDAAGTSVGGRSFDRGYSKSVAATGLTITVTLYVANGFAKPAQIDFVPYEFTWSNILALVFIRETTIASVERRFAELSFYGDLATDPLPGSATISQIEPGGGSTPLADYSGGFDVTGKTFLGFFETAALSEPAGCVKPIPASGPARWLFSFDGWPDGDGTTTLELLQVDQPFASSGSSGASFSTL